jgi:hypothetical protein
MSMERTHLGKAIQKRMGFAFEMKTNSDSPIPTIKCVLHICEDRHEVVIMRDKLINRECGRRNSMRSSDNPLEACHRARSGNSWIVIECGSVFERKTLEPFDREAMVRSRSRVGREGGHCEYPMSTNTHFPPFYRVWWAL